MNIKIYLKRSTVWFDLFVYVYFHYGHGLLQISFFHKSDYPHVCTTVGSAPVVLSCSLLKPSVAFFCLTYLIQLSYWSFDYISDLCTQEMEIPICSSIWFCTLICCSYPHWTLCSSFQFCVSFLVFRVYPRASVGYDPFSPILLLTATSTLNTRWDNLFSAAFGLWKSSWPFLFLCHLFDFFFYQSFKQNSVVPVLLWVV